MNLFDRLIAASLPITPKPIVRHFARPYLAGETIEEMVRTVGGINAEGFLCAISILGEFVTQREESEAAVREYKEVLDTIQTRNLNSNIHIKLSHMGLKLDKEFCYQNIRELLTHAKTHSNFIRLDMEDSSMTSDTLDMYERLKDEFDNVGVVIQSCLRRSLDDARRLAKIKGNVRVVKGIYIEPRSISYHDKEIIRSSYVRILEELLGAGCYTAIATHDERLVYEGYNVVDRLGLEPSQYEFQMLLGVDAPLRRIILDSGHRLRVAVPFGAKWYPYSLRRLRENPTVAGYVFKAVISPPKG
jgi:proline dehydrogenase